MISKLSIKNLNFGYHNKRILKDFFMNVNDGQIVSIVGPNGSGKSTLIKCIDRILIPSTGDVTVDRCNTGKMGRLEIAKKIAYVPQSALRVFPNTVFDVVLMGRRPYLSWKGDRSDEEKVWEVLRLL
ncbi:MAG: ABC transporter ATP-binding protein, partial [Desulfobacteraceae bacterium]